MKWLIQLKFVICYWGLFNRSSLANEDEKLTHLRARDLLKSVTRSLPCSKLKPPGGNGGGGQGGGGGGGNSKPPCGVGDLSTECPGVKGKQSTCSGTCSENGLVCDGSVCAEPPGLTCTDSLCGNDVATRYVNIGCDSSSLSLDVLGVYDYTNNDNTDVLITFLGPTDPAQAAALVITSSHGGSLKPSYIPDRTENDPDYCPSSGCKILKDSYTKEISQKLANHVITNYCKVPYLIINELHRSKLDANRERSEATFEDPIAIEAWTHFHDFIRDAQVRIQNQFGTVTNAQGLAGIQGLLFDVHGYAGRDWDSVNGAGFIQWGYRLGTDTLDQQQHCPVDDDLASTSTRGTYTHARKITGESLECLVRGPKSVGQRFNEHLPIIQTTVGITLELCGRGLPSFEYQDPKAIASDPMYCDDSDGICHYYSGGYDVRVHERLDWFNDPDFTDIHMNTVQAEFPRCIRFATDDTRTSVHEYVADKLSISLCSFMYDLFGSNANTC